VSVQQRAFSFFKRKTERVNDVDVGWSAGAGQAHGQVLPMIKSTSGDKLVVVSRQTDRPGEAAY